MTRILVWLLAAASALSSPPAPEGAPPRTWSPLPSAPPSWERDLLTSVPGAAEGVDVRHYRFALTLTDESDEILGEAEITVRFPEGAIDSLTLDLVGPDQRTGTGMEVEEVTEEARPLDHRHVQDQLVLALDPPPAPGEERSFRVVYRGVPADGLIIGTNLFGERTFFGDNWPERARHWLPTVDHPSDKATVDWVITAPEHYDVVGNGRLVERSALDDGTVRTHWATDVPIPTKVMVIGAARFAVDTLAVVGGIPVEAWVYPQNREAGVHDFALAERALRFFLDGVGPFPYAKLANVQSKTRYGGMENASAVFYSERAVRGDRRNEGLIVHEIAHQWFGDSVTELEWPHVWLSEGFATYLTHLYNESTYGRELLVEGLERDRRTVLRYFAERPELPLVPEQLTDPNEMLNRNAYQKGAWVLHMLRRQVGEKAFRDGIRAYYDEFRDGNALTRDLQGVMERVSEQDLAWFFRQWTEEPGHPFLEGSWTWEAGAAVLNFELHQVHPAGTVFRFPLDVGVVSSDGVRTAVTTVQVTEGTHTFSIPLDSEPSEVVLDPDTWLLFQGQVVERKGALR